MPVLHIPADTQTTAAKTVSNSVTFRFAKALARHLPKVRRMIRGEAAAAEVERFEFAPLARMLGYPLVVMAHNEGDPETDKMDLVLSRHWRINAAAEWLAFRLARRIFCVTPRIRDRLAERYPSQARKAEVLTVSVDTDLFHATPFDLSSGKLKLVYAGRLDEFKDPALMFRVARRLHEALNGQFEFHFCGSADPHRFPEFAAIEPYTVRHGALLPEGVAAVMRQVHMGILVSHWEGMPCFLLESCWRAGGRSGACGCRSSTRSSPKASTAAWSSAARRSRNWRPWSPAPSSSNGPTSGPARSIRRRSTRRSCPGRSTTS